MGRPVDRVAGVVLVTDYGALDRALACQKARQEAKMDATREQLKAFVGRRGVKTAV